MGNRKTAKSWSRGDRDDNTRFFDDREKAHGWDDRDDCDSDRGDKSETRSDRHDRWDHSRDRDDDRHKSKHDRDKDHHDDDHHDHEDGHHDHHDHGDHHDYDDHDDHDGHHSCDDDDDDDDGSGGGTGTEIVAVDDAFTLTEDDGATTFDVTLNDTLPTGAVVDVTIVGNVTADIALAGGEITFNPGNDFQFLPVGASETFTFTYTVSDGAGGTDSANATLTVVGVNDAPEAVAIDAGSVTNDQSSFTIDLLATASDVDAGTDLDVANVVITTNLTDAYTILLDETTGELVLDPSQFVTLRPEFSEVITVTYDVIDGDGGVTQNTATLTVIGVGGAGDRDVVGTDADEVLSGGGGNDTVSGLGGNDSLFGLAGDDTLLGGDGNDVLNGGAGNDTLTGGAGADDFIWTTGDDVITDFTVADGDRLDLSGLGFVDLGDFALGAGFAPTADGLLITFDNGTDSGSVLIEGLALGDFFALDPATAFVFA